MPVGGFHSDHFFSWQYLYLNRDTIAIFNREIINLILDSCMLLYSKNCIHISEYILNNIVGPLVK